MPKSKLFANERAKGLHAKGTSAAWIATVVLETVVLVLCVTGIVSLVVVLEAVVSTDAK